MGIRISESSQVFHVPYGPFTSEGTPDTGFVDLKAKPEWVPVIPPCIGWPETRDLLRAINSPRSTLMTLAADQVFIAAEQPGKVVLTSFVTVCFAECERNGKRELAKLAAFLEARVSALLQEASNSLQRALFLNVVLELQPTVFHEKGVSGWSLTILLAAYGSDAHDARITWGIGMKAIRDALAEQHPLM